MSGLDGVIATETALSDVDGEAGRLIIRGRPVDELVAHCRYEDVLSLLWEGLFPECDGANRLDAALGQARAHVFAQVRAADAQLLALPTVDAVRSLLGRLEDGSDLAAALSLAAAPAVFTPAVIRLTRGLEAIPPDPRLPHAADVLRMLHGNPASPAQATALDRYLVSASDHGLNASTFTARVIASRRAGAGARHARRDRSTQGGETLARGRAGARRAADGIRAPDLPRARSASGRDQGDARPACACRRPRSLAAAARGSGRAGRDRSSLATQAGTAAANQSGVLHRPPAGSAGLPPRGVHVRLRGRPGRGMDRPCPRANAAGPADQALVTLRGTKGQRSRLTV